MVDTATCFIGSNGIGCISCPGQELNNLHVSDDAIFSPMLPHGIIKKIQSVIVQMAHSARSADSAGNIYLDVLDVNKIDKLEYNIENKNRIVAFTTCDKEAVLLKTQDSSVNEPINLMNWARQSAMSLFGEVRDLNEEENKLYRNMLRNKSKKTGVNFFDLL